MCQGAEHTGSGVYSGADDDRVTKVGKFIRATSIDAVVVLNKNERKSFMLLFQNLLNKIR